jgi:uncharacterized membrane protein YoaK (UPF0700 family)
VSVVRLPNEWRSYRAFPPLLLTLTCVTGAVDAVSYLKLGRVFVANMTGNVVFLGFGLAGSLDVSISASLVAMAAFLLGALAGGRLHSRRKAHRGQHLSVAAAIGLAMLLVALIVSVVWGADGPLRYVLTAVLALAMGLQNSTARALAVADLTTTVLTQTLTGIAADSPAGHGKRRAVIRRLGSVITMLVGALLGALLSLKVGVSAALALACVLQAGVAATVGGLSAGTASQAWESPKAG